MNSTARKLFATLLTLMAFIFFLGSAAHSVVAQEPKPPAQKCPVCHNGHTILIDCRQVAKYLQKHPGDTVGECEGVSDEKPSTE
jgi:hypothetical protein